MRPGSGRIARRLLLLFLLVCSPNFAQAPAEAELPFLLGGIQVNEPNHRQWSSALRAAEMNSVEATVYAFQGDWNSEQLWWNDEELAVEREIRTAKAAGLHVVLVLRLALDHSYPENRFLWHGQVLPASEEKIDAWFERYRRFVSRWAEFAQREGVDLLAIGSEMKALVATTPISRIGLTKRYQGFKYYQRFLRKRTLRFAEQLKAKDLVSDGSGSYVSAAEFAEARFEAQRRWARSVYRGGESRRLERINATRAQLLSQWRRLIRETRQRYDGLLTYAANFDHYDQVAFWDELDWIGINSYFSLHEQLDAARDGEQMLHRFEAAWDEIYSKMDRFKRQQGIENRPTLLTEIGFTFRRHSTVEPWNHQGFTVVGWKTRRRRLVVWRDEPVDYDERALAMRALLNVQRRREDRLAGLLWWKLSTIKAHEEIEPFVLHIGTADTESADPLVRTLAEFHQLSERGDQQ